MSQNLSLYWVHLFPAGTVKFTSQVSCLYSRVTSVSGAPTGPAGFFYTPYKLSVTLVYEAAVYGQAPAAGGGGTPNVTSE